MDFRTSTQTCAVGVPMLLLLLIGTANAVVNTGTGDEKSTVTRRDAVSYGVPSESYGAPPPPPPPLSYSGIRQTYGSPRPVYGPPRPSLKPPFEPDYGAPPSQQGPHYGEVPPPTPVYNVPQPPRPPSYGVPSVSYGVPSVSYAKGPPGVPSPPTPPHITYHGWQPIPGLSIPYVQTNSGYGPPPKPEYGPPPKPEYGPPPKPEYGPPPKPEYGPPPKPEYGPPPKPEYGPPPKPEYGPPPKPEYGPPPKPEYGPPPKPEYGPPPKPEYGPPPKPEYGPPPKSEYGTPPKPEYGPPPKPEYGPPPKPEYGPPPKPEYGAPPKPEYGAPSQGGSCCNVNNVDVVDVSYGGGPPPVPPSSNYGPPTNGNAHSSSHAQSLSDLYKPPPIIPTTDYGPPAPPKQPIGSYGPPQKSDYGPPPKTDYGPPIKNSYASPPSGSYGVPPAGSYGSIPKDTYRPPPLSLSPPSGSYGAPAGGSYGPPPEDYYRPPPPPPSGSYGAPPKKTYDAPPNDAYGSPPRQSYGPPKESYGVPKESYGVPKESYGVPKESYGVPKESYGVPKESYGSPVKPVYHPPPKTSYAPPPSGPFRPPSSGGGSYGIPPPSGGGSYGLPSKPAHGVPVKDSYGVPASGSYSSSSNGGTYGTLPSPPKESYGVPASGSYGSPPSGGSYGTLPPPPPPPPKDSYGVPSATGYGSAPFKNAFASPPKNSYGVLAAAFVDNSLHTQYAPASSNGLPSEGTFGVPLAICCGTPPPDLASQKPSADNHYGLAYGQASGKQIPGPNIQPKTPVINRPPVPVGLVESTQYHGFQGEPYIPPPVPEVPTSGGHDDRQTATAASAGGESSYRYETAPAASAGGESSYRYETAPASAEGAGDYGAPQQSFEVNEPLPREASNDYGKSATTANAYGSAGGDGEGVNVNEIVKSLGLEGPSVVRSQSVDIDNGLPTYPVRGAGGDTYTLQFQPGQGGGEQVAHDQVISNGLLQDILSAIESQQKSEPSPQYYDSQAQGSELRQRVSAAGNSSATAPDGKPEMALFFSTADGTGSTTMATMPPSLPTTTPAETLPGEINQLTVNDVSSNGNYVQYQAKEANYAYYGKTDDNSSTGRPTDSHRNES